MVPEAAPPALVRLAPFVTVTVDKGQKYALKGVECPGGRRGGRLEARGAATVGEVAGEALLDLAPGEALEAAGVALGRDLRVVALLVALQADGVVFQGCVFPLVPDRLVRIMAMDARQLRITLAARGVGEFRLIPRGNSIRVARTVTGVTAGADVIHVVVCPAQVIIRRLRSDHHLGTMREEFGPFLLSFRMGFGTHVTCLATDAQVNRMFRGFEPVQASEYRNEFLIV